MKTIPPGIPVSKYYIYEITNNVANLKDSVDKPGIINLSDRDATLKTHCFKIGYKDQCNIIAELSPEACSIHISLAANNLLKWTTANPFCFCHY
ncbi:MAG: hypothetical protein IPH28_23455 [Cytophagaceae bacterium]|nr:hypothetical protein [Cytophagaceae bacterium]